MRFMLTVRIPMDRGNAAIKDGSIGTTLQSILSDIKAEAAYFTAIDGLRGGYIIVNLDDVSQIPAIAEPLFLGLGATVEFQPVMTMEDFGKVEPTLPQVIQKYL